MARAEAVPLRAGFVGDDGLQECVQDAADKSQEGAAIVDNWHGKLLEGRAQT